MGWSRPSCVRIVAIRSGVAFLPASCCAGSPGIANMMTNVMTVTPMRTMTSWISRRMT